MTEEIKEYSNFYEMFDLAVNIINTVNEQKPLEKLQNIRHNKNKYFLRGYYYIAQFSKDILTIIGSSKSNIKISLDTLIKNIIEHPEISINEYLKIQIYVETAEYVLLKNDKKLIYFKIDKNLYQFVIKTTKNNDENFITTFHKASIKQLEKDIQRYKQLKR